MTSLDWWQQSFPQGQQQLAIKDSLGEEVAIAYGERGTGQPLFLLHGIGSWSYNWRYSITPLAQCFRVICTDAKGYGFSQAPQHAEEVGHQVIELERIIHHFTDESVVLIGESMGALVALALAQARPHLIDRLVVLNAPIFAQELPSWGMRLLADAPLEWVQWIDRLQLLRPIAPLVRELTRVIRSEIVVDPNSITDEELYWATYPYIEIPGTLTQFASDLQLAALEIQRLQQNQPNWISRIQQNLSRITCPTLILWSECDRWFPVSHGEKLRDRIPHAQFQTLPNCGHLASGGDPDTVNAAILAFLQA